MINSNLQLGLKSLDLQVESQNHLLTNRGTEVILNVSNWLSDLQEYCCKTNVIFLEQETCLLEDLKRSFDWTAYLVHSN